MYDQRCCLSQQSMSMFSSKPYTRNRMLRKLQPMKRPMRPPSPLVRSQMSYA